MGRCRSGLNRENPAPPVPVKPQRPRPGLRGRDLRVPRTGDPSVRSLHAGTPARAVERRPPPCASGLARTGRVRCPPGPGQRAGRLDAGLRLAPPDRGWQRGPRCGSWTTTCSWSTCRCGSRPRHWLPSSTAALTGTGCCGAGSGSTARPSPTWSSGGSRPGMSQRWPRLRSGSSTSAPTGRHPDAFTFRSLHAAPDGTAAPHAGCGGAVALPCGVSNPAEDGHPIVGACPARGVALVGAHRKPWAEPGCGW